MLAKWWLFHRTTVDSQIILQRLKDKKMKSCDSSVDSCKFGNSVYSIEFDDASTVIKALNEEIKSEDHKKISDQFLDSIPKYGAQYLFHLEEVVDCPEFLVNFDELIDLAEKNNMTLVAKQGFENFFKCKRETKEGKNLLGMIKALERYPACHGYKLVGNAINDNYDAAQKYLQKFPDLILDSMVKPDIEPACILYDRFSKTDYIGTLSKEEWEAVTLYCVFAFKKRDSIPE